MKHPKHIVVFTAKKSTVLNQDNIKAKTAKSMSLQFTLLIITGYISGIIAKIANDSFNYVLVIYFLNLIIVSANIVVYFINLRYDKKQIA